MLDKERGRGLIKLSCSFFLVFQQWEVCVMYESGLALVMVMNSFLLTYFAVSISLAYEIFFRSVNNKGNIEMPLSL